MDNTRYQRHSLIDWFSQDKVTAARFAIIGCGAVGNEVAKNLALLGVGNIDLFDFDTIEIHNLTRSVLFREADVGKTKAEVASAKLKQLDPNIKVNAFVGDFWDLLTLEQVQSYDCILCCVDNFEARIKLNQLCLIGKTNLINTGIDSKFSSVEVFPFKSTAKVACYECNLPASTYERMQQRYSCGWLKKISFIEKKIPTTIITSSLTGALAASMALNLLKDDNSEQQAKRILTDTTTGNATLTDIEHYCECPGCSSINDDILIVKASAKIDNKLCLPEDNEINLTTSEPVLVSYRCVNCNPNQADCTIVFDKAKKFDSSLNICKTCNTDGVDVTIKDSFTTTELLTDFANMQLPVKFIHFNHDKQTTIIELE